MIIVIIDNDNNNNNNSHNNGCGSCSKKQNEKEGSLHWECFRAGYGSQRAIKCGTRSHGIPWYHMVTCVVHLGPHFLRNWTINWFPSFFSGSWIDQLKGYHFGLSSQPQSLGEEAGDDPTARSFRPDLKKNTKILSNVRVRRWWKVMRYGITAFLEKIKIDKS